MEGLINVTDFMEHLRRNDLVIVSRRDLLDSSKIELDLLRRDLLKRKDLSIKQVVDAKFLPITTKSGVRNWIAEGKFKTGEVFKNSVGEIRILTVAIKRLGYVE